MTFVRHAFSSTSTLSASLVLLFAFSNPATAQTAQAPDGSAPGATPAALAAPTAGGPSAPSQVKEETTTIVITGSRIHSDAVDQGTATTNVANGNIVCRAKVDPSSASAY